MTELAEAPTAGRDQAVTRIPHWIGGKRVDGTSGRSGPVYNPATGEQSGEVDFASVEEIDAPSRHATEAFADVAVGVALEARRALLPHPRARSTRTARISRASSPPSTGRCCRTRSARCARARGDRVRLRDPDAAQGRVLRAGLDRDRRLLDPPAARRRRRASRRSTSPRWCPCGCGRPRSPAATASSSSRPRRTRPRRSSPPSCSRRPACRTASSTSCTATRSPSTRSSSTPTSPRSRFVGSTPIARYVYETGTKARQARAGARRREEPHDRAARRRHRHGRRRGGLSAGYGSAGERCMAISVLVAVGDVADPLVEAIKERLPKVKVGDGLEPDVGDGAARHARAPRQGRVVPRRRARRRARRSSPTAARRRPTATASSSACRCSTT